MGWIAITKELQILREESDGRPVQAGEEGNLLAILQEDFGHRVAIDLTSGGVAIDYDTWVIQDGKFYVNNPRLAFVICEETTIVGELEHIDQRIEPLRDEQGRKILTEDGRWAMVRTDYMTPLIWRPIWFSRITNGIPTKVIGAQTTTPKDFGARNVKKMISLFMDGRIGVD